MSHNRQDKVDDLRNNIEYKVLDLTDYLLEEVRRLEEEKAEQAEALIAKEDIIIGQKGVIVKYKNLLGGMKRVAA